MKWAADVWEENKGILDCAQEPARLAALSFRAEKEAAQKNLQGKMPKTIRNSAPEIDQESYVREIGTSPAAGAEVRSGGSKADKFATKTLRLIDLKRQLAAAADPVRAESLSRYCRAEKGGYGEGDQFLGITVPALRAITRRFTHLPLQQIGKLLASPIHEERLAALMVLVTQYSEADARARRQIFDFYLKCTRSIDNWDLVDASAREIVGIHLLERSRRPLRRLAKSENVWERRIAIVATHAFLRAGEVEETFAIARLLLGDNHDLIHKAVGWMLREAGKQSMPELLQFLEKNYTLLPRTTLRYAIERLPTMRRKRILLGRFD